MSNVSYKTWSFPGGIVLDGHKQVSTADPIAHIPLSQEYILPLSQHIGEAAAPCVAVGDKVLKGQRIADAEGYVSVPLHAPTSGTITAIEPRDVPHPSGLKTDCIILKADGEDSWCEHAPVENYMAMDRSALRNLMKIKPGLFSMFFTSSISGSDKSKSRRLNNRHRQVRLVVVSLIAAKLKVGFVSLTQHRTV